VCFLCYHVFVHRLNCGQIGDTAGSAEGFSQADKAINSATKSGRWVMLKNVHLAPQWLVQLEKKLHSLTPHANFRLFLTMEINPKVNYFISCSVTCTAAT